MRDLVIKPCQLIRCFEAVRLVDGVLHVRWVRALRSQSRAVRALRA
jgi:hypothetical protein